MNILVIGGGNMGYTYAWSMQNANAIDRSHISILETYPPKIDELRKDGLFEIYDSPLDCVKGSKIILLAVKPQHSKDLFRFIKQYLHQNQLVISIMAGVKISTIQQSLGIKKVVRAMPNLPAQVGKGMTSFCCTREINSKDKKLVKKILNSTGISIEVGSEDAIDATTGISGSGPAYVFYFMQSMMQAAEKLGFSTEESKLLVSQTFDGAIQLYKQKDLSTAEWINRVASKGGTTRAALDSFKKNNLGEKIIAGALAAYDRAAELGSAS